MKQAPLKKWRIHILSTNGLKPGVFEYPLERNAFLICTDRSNSFLKNTLTENKLVIPFPDAEDKRYPGCFNGAHARKIIRFLQEPPDDITDIYVCCSKGGSRSPATAAAILKMSGRSDKDVWLNPYYVPNILVYERLCREFGIFMPHILVLLKLLANNISFFWSQKKGNSGKYERWQILE